METYPKRVPQNRPGIHRNRRKKGLRSVSSRSISRRRSNAKLHQGIRLETLRGARPYHLPSADIVSGTDTRSPAISCQKPYEERQLAALHPIPTTRNASRPSKPKTTLHSPDNPGICREQANERLNIETLAKHAGFLRHVGGGEPPRTLGWRCECVKLRSDPGTTPVSRCDVEPQGKGLSKSPPTTPWKPRPTQGVLLVARGS